MSKEKIIEELKKLSPEERFEVFKAVMPEFCQEMRTEPQRMQEMMKMMMAQCGGDMSNWMNMMGLMNMKDK